MSHQKLWKHDEHRLLHLKKKSICHWMLKMKTAKTITTGNLIFSKISFNYCCQNGGNTEVKPSIRPTEESKLSYNWQGRTKTSPTHSPTYSSIATFMTSRDHYCDSQWPYYITSSDNRFVIGETFNWFLFLSGKFHGRRKLCIIKIFHFSYGANLKIHSSHVYFYYLLPYGKKFS